MTMKAVTLPIKLIIGVISLILILGIGYFVIYEKILHRPLTLAQLTTLIEQSHLNSALTITATPEVLKALDKILDTHSARTFMQESLQRMDNYQDKIEKILADNDIPSDFIALPLVESHYLIPESTKNSAGPAGIWQLTSTTAQNFGLTVNNQRDDRLDVILSTQAAAKYLKMLYGKYHNWNLVLLAYNVGDGGLDNITQKVNSTDVWTIARSPSAPAQLLPFLAVFQANVIVMHNPDLLNAKASKL